MAESMGDHEVSIATVSEEINAGKALSDFDAAILKRLAETIARDNQRATLFDKLLTHISKEEGVLKTALRREILANSEKLLKKEIAQETGEWNLPDNYYLDKGFIYKTTKDGYQQVCEYCLVNEIHQTTDRQESVISLFFPRRHKQILIETDEFVDNKKLETKLVNYDIFIGAKLKQFKDYISDFITYNEANIKKIVLTSSTGWQFIDVIKYENGEFIRANKLRYCNPIMESAVEYIDTIQKRIYKEGDYKTAIDILNVGLKYRGSALSILSALSSTLIYPLRKKGLGNFITNFAGTTGKGKTLSARIGLSMFGNATEGENSLASNMNSTSVGHEIKFNQFRDMPNLLDEAGTTKGSAEVKARAVLDTIFQFFSGQGRSRATKTLKLREETVFRGVLFLTMEYELQQIEKMANTQEKGYFRRTIEVFSESEDFLPSKDVFDFGQINSTFGHIGEIFISSIMENYNEIESDFIKFEKELSKPELRGKEKYFSVLRVTLEQLKRLKLITQKTYNETLKHLSIVYNENLEIMQEITSKADKKWAQQLLEFVAMHGSQFEDGENEVKGVKLGSINRGGQTTGKELRMFPKALEDFLMDNGINLRAFCKKMSENNILKTEISGGKIRFKVKRDNQRMYVFNFEKLDKYDSDEDGIEYEEIKIPQAKKEETNIIQIGDSYFNLDDANVEEKLTNVLKSTKSKELFIMELERSTTEFIVEYTTDNKPFMIKRIPF